MINSKFRRLSYRKLVNILIGRRHLPEFISCAKRAQDESFMQFIVFGMKFDHDVAISSIDWAEKCRKEWAESEQQNEISNRDLRKLFIETLESSLSARDSNQPVTMGLSSGFDSRPLLQHLREMAIEPITYTYGQTGNLDFDLVTELSRRVGLEKQIFVDTSEATWSLEQFDTAMRRCNDMPISPRILTITRMNDDYPNRMDVHGFLNDTLTESLQSPSKSWPEAIAFFCKMNDMFGFQSLLSHTIPASLLPQMPWSNDIGMNYDQ